MPPFKFEIRINHRKDIEVKKGHCEEHCRIHHHSPTRVLRVNKITENCSGILGIENKKQGNKQVAGIILCFHCQQISCKKHRYKNNKKGYYVSEVKFH